MPLSFRSRFLTETFFDTYVSLRKSGQRLAPCGLHAKWPTKLRATQGGELTRKVVPMKSICCRHPRKLSGIELKHAPPRARSFVVGHALACPFYSRVAKSHTGNDDGLSRYRFAVGFPLSGRRALRSEGGAHRARHCTPEPLRRRERLSRGLHHRRARGGRSRIFHLASALHRRHAGPAQARSHLAGGPRGGPQPRIRSKSGSR